MTLSADRTSPDKATLYCPECGHRSPIDGDWIVRVRADSTSFECPDCGTTIDSRRDREALIAGRGPTSVRPNTD